MGEHGAAFSGVTRRGRRAPVIAAALLALGVLAVAFVSRQAAPPTSRATQDPQVAPFTARPSGPSPLVAAGPQTAPTDAPPSRNPAAKPYPTYAAVPVDFGATQLRPDGAGPVRVSVDLPPGWDRLTDGMVVRSGGAGVPLSIGVWRLANVDTYPCRWSAAAHADPTLLETTAGQAVALASWWGQDPGTPALSNSGIAPLASHPEQTTVAGHAAWYVEVLVPTGLDLGQCDGRQLVLWEGANGEVRYALGPSEVNRIWVVDSGSGPIVIDAGLPLAATGSQRAELQAVVDSIAIEP